MSKLEHATATYFEFDLIRREIQAASLSDTAVLAHAKKQKLYDKTEQKRLQARVGPGIRPHFYELSDSSSKRKLFEGEHDPIHNQRVSDLLGKLEKLSKLEPVMVHKVPEAPDRLESLYSLHDYSWGAEVHRVLDAGTIVRNDIYGQRLALAMSVNRPWIAIEVINTHYPDEQAFTALLEASRRYPLIVLFDFTAYPNTFVKVDLTSSSLCIRPSSFYIKDGALWKGAYPTKNNSSLEFKLEFEKMVAGWKTRRALLAAATPSQKN